MAYDSHLADRIYDSLKTRGVAFHEKKMMGGLIFMVDDKMCLGIVKDHLMARIGPDRYDEALQIKGCKEMDFTGRPMKGYVFIAPEGVDLEEDLEHWVQWALDYNPLAKASKKKKTPPPQPQ